MTIKTQVSKLLDMQMDRREFLKYIGVGILAITGVNAALRYVAPKQQASHNTGLVYGGSTYGGIVEINPRFSSNQA